MSDMQKLVDLTVPAVLAKFAPVSLHDEELAVTVLKLDDETKSQSDAGQYRGDIHMYPASVIKMFYLVAAHRWLEDGRILDTPELRRALHDMIVHSGNESTAYVVDVLTDTTSGPELPPAELLRWHEKRNSVNRYFQSLGYLDINANRKTWHEGPYGRDKQAVDQFTPSRNFLTTNGTARLLAEIAGGICISRSRCGQMLELMKRDFMNPASEDCQARDFIGRGLPSKARLWSKAGYMSTARHDAAIVEFAGGRKFILVIFTTRPDNKDIIPEITRQLVAGFERI